MAQPIKNQEAILQKLNITTLNPMQEEAKLTIHNNNNTIILSPTGTGKTLAFLLPLIAELDPTCEGVQALILVPTRELAIQIEQVIRDMGSGFKANAVYGGRAGAKDRMDLRHLPAILIGTPGRIADRFYRDQLDTRNIKFLVLDEFDKSLEIGFEVEMEEIIDQLRDLKKRVLTSATDSIDIPTYVGLEDPVEVNYLHEKNQQLSINTFVSPEKDKLESLLELVKAYAGTPGIIFCNFKESIQRVSDFLFENNIPHGSFHGSMEQKDREEALIRFRNGSHQLLLATDLAARGIDVPEISFIIHYHLPHREQEFTHRNGRTARMNQGGTAIILHWVNENLPDFIEDLAPKRINLDDIVSNNNEVRLKTTLFIGGGRRDKISKGDIVGLLAKQGKLQAHQIGQIELKQDCAYVAVDADCVDTLIPLVHNTKLKTKKVRIKAI